jgi:hypothetical protein
VAAAVNACRADAEQQCSTITRYVQKVACIKDALNNLGDDCKAATAYVLLRYNDGRRFPFLAKVRKMTCDSEPANNNRQE